MKVEDMKKAELVEYVGKLESAILPFSAFSPSLKMADIQRLTAVDIGIGVERLRAVIELCDEINAREDVEVGPSS